MTVSIADVAERIGVQTVEIPGRGPVEMKALSVRQQREIVALMPAPVPQVFTPGAKPGDKPVRDFEDPGYIRSFADWSYTVQALEIAIAMGLTLSDGSVYASTRIGDSYAAWAKRCRQELEDAFTAETLKALHKAASASGSASKDAEGNSSATPSGPASE